MPELIREFDLHANLAVPDDVGDTGFGHRLSVIGTDYGDQYFFTSPRLETGDERYTWVNNTVFLGEGRAVPGPAVEYRVYRVANA